MSVADTIKQQIGFWALAEATAWYEREGFQDLSS